MAYSFPQLCTPAYIYLVISVVALVMMGFQNMGSNTEYCAGSYSCAVSNTMFLFCLKMLYVVFWTWVLNLICKSGASVVSWVLVLLPILVMFILIALYMISGNRTITLSQSGFV